MGSKIEINDTLKISKERGFPQELNLEGHVKDPESSKRVLNLLHNFWNNKERLYNLPPTRVFLVEEMEDGKWLYWGNAIITELLISAGQTSGKYMITKIYRPEFQKQITIEESPDGKSYFSDKPKSLRSNL